MVSKMTEDLTLNMDAYLPLRDVVFNTLREAILKGELKPGERLMELQLAAKLGVSRTPIREAIRMLEQEGLAVTIPRKGAEVAKMTEKDMEDVLQIREALDELAAKIACEQGKEVTYQGEKYVYNEDLVSILFLGVDKEAFEEGGTVGDGKAGQADALFLLVLDTKTGKSRLIAISRDTMTDVNVYSDLGNFIGTEKLQLCLAYTYGDGKEKSCENTVRAVSRLFYGMPVAAYAALDLDAIAVLTDAVGGVEVTVTKDLTIQDPSLKEGERKVLTGEQAQWYVRSRLVEEKEATADANSDRIERQKQYLAAFGGKAAEQFRKNPLFLLTLYQKIKDFSVTNLSAAEVTYLGTLLFRGGFQDTGILSIKGEASMGETYAEFHVDEQAMYEMVLEVFYRKAGKDHEK